MSEDEKFRQEVRAFVEGHLPPAIARKAVAVPGRDGHPAFRI